MTRAFVDPRRPDGAVFDGMSHAKSPMDKLYITKVLHKAFVEVNEKGQAIVIMGDQATPYALLKRVLATSAEAGFRDVSLAVDSRPLPAGIAVTDQLAVAGGGQ